MKKSLTNTISIVAIIISLVAISFVAFRWTPFKLDAIGFFGWTTGALSVMVVVATLYQYITIRDLKAEIRRIAKEEDIILTNELSTKITEIESKITKEWNLQTESIRKEISNTLNTGSTDQDKLLIILKSLLHMQADNASKSNDMDVMITSLNNYVNFIVFNGLHKFPDYAIEASDVIQQCLDNSMKDSNVGMLFSLKEPWRIKQIYKLFNIIDSEVKLPKDAIGWAFTIAEKNGQITHHSSTEDFINKNK